MKSLLVGVGVIATVAAPTVALSSSSDKNSSNNLKVNLNKKIEYLYNGKIYNSKDKIYRDYILAHPNLIKQKNVVGDIGKSIIDFDSNMLNVSDLPDFDPSKIQPVYVMPDGNYEKSFEKAQKSQVNLALTTNDYTDGFGNFFKFPAEAKSSYGRRVFNGDLAVNNMPMMDGRNIEYNPLSEDDSKSFKDQSLKYLQSSGSVLKNHYSREYFKDGKKIDDFYNLFNSAKSVKSDTDSMLSRYILMQAVNDTKSNGIDISAPIYNPDALNQVKVDTSHGLRGFSSDAKLTQYAKDIYKYRDNLSNAEKANDKASQEYISAHANKINPNNITINGMHDKSSNRYNFKYVQVLGGPSGQGLDSDKDNGDVILFNGVKQPHKASYYQRFVRWDGDADCRFIGYYFKLYFHDNFTNSDDCITIWAHGGMDSDDKNEDYMSFSILNNKLFNRYVPVWGGYTTLSNTGPGDVTYACGPARNNRATPWIMGDHDWDYGDDNEWGKVLNGIPSYQIRGNNPSVYNGNSTKDIISKYKNRLFKYLNDKSKQPVINNNLSINANEIHMTNHETALYGRNPSKLKEYIKLSSKYSDSLTAEWLSHVNLYNVHLESYGSSYNMVANYSSQSIYSRTSPVGRYTFPTGIIHIPITLKHDFSIDNDELSKRSNELNDPGFKGVFNTKSTLTSSTFDPSESILSTHNNKITLSYDQYKALISGTTNKDSDWSDIYIDVVSKQGLHIPYLLDLKSLISKQENIVFSNLLDSKNIKDEDRESNISLTIDFSKLDFEKGGNGDLLSGIHLKWNLLKQYNIKASPTNLDMRHIDNELIGSNSLVMTIEELLNRDDEYNLSEATKDIFNNFIGKFDTLIKERISHNDIPMSDITRRSVNEGVDGISLIKNDDYNINTLFSVLSDETIRGEVINAYNKGYLAEFKELLRNAVINPSNKDNLMAHSYVLTLQNYIKTSSISGQLPNDTKFKIPALNNLILFTENSTVKNYVVRNQYSFNGSLLTNKINAIGDGNLFNESDKDKIEKYKNGIIENFNPPRTTRLYDINGRPFQIDDTGSLLYDNEETVVANALLKATPQRINGMVFYDGIPEPILNQVSMIYYTTLDDEMYYFTSSDSIKNFIKGYLDRFIKIVEGDDYV